jgi:AAA domain
MLDEKVQAPTAGGSKGPEGSANKETEGSSIRHDGDAENKNQSDRQRAEYRAAYLAQTSGGDPEDYLKDRYKPKSKWSYQNGELRDGSLIDEYIYQDEHGTFYHKVERREGKQFPQYTWDAKKLAWVPGAPQRKVPYHLPLIIERKDEPIWVTEGEKDADNLDRWHLVATTNPGGAGKWTPDLDAWFKDRIVYLIPDNDNYGRDHMKKVARHLLKVVKELRMVRLINLPDKGDVSDWIEAGGTKDALLALAATAQIERPALLSFFSSGDFVQGFVPPDYVLDGIVQRRFLYALTGRSNSGKTAILHRLAAHVAQGLPLCGRDVEKTNVLYLAGENPEDHRMRWIYLCDELKVDPASIPITWLPFRVDLSEPEILEQIRQQNETHGPFGLIIADTSQAYFQGDNENDNPQMLDHAKMFRGLIDLLPEGPAIVVSCHPTKNGDKLVPRGGSSFFNEIDTNLSAETRTGTTVANLHWTEKIRGVDFAPLPFELRRGQTDKLKDAKGRQPNAVRRTLQTLGR